jgi:hypothetical protein
LKAESLNQFRNVKQKFDGIKTCAGIVDDIRASVRLSAHQKRFQRDPARRQLAWTGKSLCTPILSTHGKISALLEQA